MKYPKLVAAIDELLAKAVREQGEDALDFLIGLATAPAPTPPEPKKEEVPSSTQS